MKIIKTLAIVALGLSLHTSALAQTEEVGKILNESKEEKPTENKRRKKVQMCHDCGKAEYDCECEGEGHGVEEEEEHTEG